MSQSAVVQVETPPKLTSLQWKSGIAAWLGWLFDGLDMHLYTLIAAPFVMQLLHAASETDAIVKESRRGSRRAFSSGGRWVARSSDGLAT